MQYPNTLNLTKTFEGINTQRAAFLPFLLARYNRRQRSKLRTLLMKKEKEMMVKMWAIGQRMGSSSSRKKDRAGNYGQL
jgi:hypothetical protein